MADRIPQDVLERARRRLKRQVIAQLIWAMGEEDATFESLAVTLELSPRQVRRYFMQMVNGEGPVLNEVSDMATALGDTIRFTLTERPAPRITAADLGLNPDGTVKEG